MKQLNIECNIKYQMYYMIIHFLSFYIQEDERMQVARYIGDCASQVSMVKRYISTLLTLGCIHEQEENFKRKPEEKCKMHDNYHCIILFNVIQLLYQLKNVGFLTKMLNFHNILSHFVIVENVTHAPMLFKTTTVVINLI